MNNYSTEDELDPKLHEQITIVRTRLIELENSLDFATNKKDIRNLSDLIAINKSFLLHLDSGMENYKLEN